MIARSVLVASIPFVREMPAGTRGSSAANAEEKDSGRMQGIGTGTSTSNHSQGEYIDLASYLLTCLECGDFFFCPSSPNSLTVTPPGCILFIHETRRFIPELCSCLLALVAHDYVYG